MPRLASKTRKAGARAGKRYPLNMRTTFDVRQKLEEAAIVSGRSLAQEAEYRIQQTFQNQKVLHEALDLSFGPHTSGLLLLVGRAIRDTTQKASFTKSADPNENLLEDRDVFDQVAEAVAAVLLDRRPVGQLIAPETSKQVMFSASDIADGIAAKRNWELARKARDGRGKDDPKK
jgi:hypothetical protein